MISQELMREVRRLQIRSRRRVEGLFAGEWLSAFKGQGVEFAEVREYEPGDDVRSIDWNVTARTGIPHIKRFVEERQQTVLILVDLSGSSRFGSSVRDKRQLEVEVAAMLALAATQANDRVGLVLFTDRVEQFVPPRKGRTHIMRMLRELLAFEPAGRGTDIRAALEFVGHVQRRRASVFIVSDFMNNPKGEDGYESALKLLAKRHDVVAVTCSDPLEHELPPVGLIDLVDAESDRHVVLDAGSRFARVRYGSTASRFERELKETLGRCGVDRVDVSTDRPFVKDLLVYFKSRERRR